MKNILFVLVVLNVLFFSNLFVAAQSTGEISKAQATLLESLPPDQKESILGKMRQAEELKSELEQTFEEGITITKRQDFLYIIFMVKSLRHNSLKTFLTMY